MKSQIIETYEQYFSLCELYHRDYLIYKSGSYKSGDFNLENIIFHIERGQFSLDIHIAKDKVETLWLQGLSHKGKKITILEIMNLFRDKACSMFKRKMNDKKEQLVNALTHLKHAEMLMAQYGYDFTNKKTSLDFEV